MRYVTIIDIARELGISKSTVSRALSGNSENVSEAMREKILATAKRMGYRRNIIAVALRRKQSRTVGIVVPDSTTTFFSSFVRQAQRALRQRDYLTLIAQSEEDPETELDCIEMLERMHVDGLLLGVCDNTANADFYREKLHEGLPIVLFDRTIRGIDVDMVSIDDESKAFFMTEHLIRSGCRHIAHLKGPERLNNSLGRMQGYRKALEKFHIDYDPDLVIDGGLNIQSGHDATAALMAKGKPIDAIFAFTELSAIGAKRYLQEKGVRIPDEVSIATMSGTLPSQLVSPTITAVDQPVNAMAEKAVEMLVKRIENPDAQTQHVTVDAEIVVRESSR